MDADNVLADSILHKLFTEEQLDKILTEVQEIAVIRHETEKVQLQGIINEVACKYLGGKTLHEAVKQIANEEKEMKVEEKNSDDIDERIVCLLRKEGVLGSNVLAREVGVSRTTLWKRLEHLSRMGLIEKTTSVEVSFWKIKNKVDING